MNAIIASAPSNGSKKFKKPRWGRTQPNHTMAWSHPDLGSFEIGVTNFKMSNTTEQVGPNNWVAIFPKDRRPKVVQVRFTGQLNDGVSLLYAQGSKLIDMMSQDRFPAFDVPITWKPRHEGEDLPHTRQKDIDNIDLILVLDDKIFQLQVSVVTRREQFWLCAQETHGGQVVRTTAEQAAELGITPHQVGDSYYAVVPLFPENNYPGADYLSNFKDVGRTLIERVVASGKVVEDYFEPEAWTHTALEAELPKGCSAERGWKKATVTFFNAVLGWGFALDEDYKPVFLHFQNILDENNRPVVSGNVLQNAQPGILQPMGAIAFKEKMEDGKRKATAIRIIE